MSLGAFVEIGGWSAVACSVWLVTLSSVTLPELCFAIAAGVPCGVLAHAGRRALEGSWRVRLRWTRWLLPLIGSLLAELVELFRVAVTGPQEGDMVTVDLPDEPAAQAAAREALGALALCASPGSLVADGDPTRSRLTVHVLVSAGPRVEEAIRR